MKVEVQGDVSARAYHPERQLSIVRVSRLKAAEDESKERSRDSGRMPLTAGLGLLNRMSCHE